MVTYSLLHLELSFSLQSLRAKMYYAARPNHMLDVQTC